MECPVGLISRECYKHATHQLYTLVILDENDFRWVQWH